MATTAPPSDLHPEPPDAEGRATRWKGLLAGVTAVLVGVPSLVNAVYDVYVSVAKLPRTDVERVNAELFRKYFGKQPIVEMPVPVRNGIGTVQARFAVYEEGDVFVEFGKQTQWFAFPRQASRRDLSLLDLLPSAHADPVGTPKPTPSVPAAKYRLYSQEGSVSGSTWYRTRIYEDGRVEKSEIDMRTGKVLDVQLAPAPRDQARPATALPPATRVLPAPTVDLSTRSRVDR